MANMSDPRVSGTDNRTHPCRTSIEGHELVDVDLVWL